MIKRLDCNLDRTNQRSRLCERAQRGRGGSFKPVRSPALSRFPWHFPPQGGSTKPSSKPFVYSGGAKRLKDLCIHLLLAFLCCWSPAQISAQSDSEITEFAQGLRTRRLFDLAETYCREGLTNRELDPTTRTSLTLELIRTQTARAAVSSGTQRIQSWAAAKQTAEDFMAAHRSHPRMLLVQVQQALTHLTHGRLLRQEIEADIASPNAREKALSELRAATSAFDEVQRTIRQLIPEQRGRTLGEHELAVEQLTTLNNNVRLQSAICGINRAQLYPSGDQLNRIDALNVGLEKLNAVRRETNSEQPLWWQTELQRAKCQRLLGQYSEAQTILSELPLKSATSAMKQAVIEQQIKLVIAMGDLRTAPQIISQVSQIKHRSPQLDLAVIELMMRLVNSGDKSWRNKASQQLVQIESNHGDYWGRRAELLVIGTAGIANNSVPDSATDQSSPDLLIRIGEQAFRKNRLDDALKAFGKAIETAESLKNWPLVFSTTVKLSQVLEKQDNNEAASKKLVELANRFVDSDNSPAAHLRGCWNYSRIVNKDPTLVSERKLEFSRLVHQHIATWPAEPSANRARIWAARQLQSEGKWQEAVDHYLTIHVDSRFFPDAIIQSAACTSALIREQPQSTTVARSYTDRLLRLLDEDELAVSGHEQVVLALARLGLAHGTVASDALAEQLQLALTRATTPKMKLAIQSWLLVALADLGKSDDEIESAFTPVSQSESAMLQSVIGINSVLKRVQDSTAGTLVETKFKLAAIALKINLSEDKRTQWMGEWTDALQRLGRDKEAVNALTELAKRQSKSAAAQMQLARGLSKINGEAATQKALSQWRRVAKQLRPHTENWYEAKYNVAMCLKDLGKQAEALKLLEYLKTIPPGWSKSKWKTDFDRLLIDCQN